LALDVDLDSMMRQSAPPRYSQQDFKALALAEFPELRPEFEDSDGLLHLEMHAFTRLMRRAQESGNWASYKRCVHLATELWSRPDDRLENALNVSLLEHLDFEGPRGSEAWQRLTTELQEAWKAMAAYNERLAAVANPSLKNTRRKGRLADL
jgi:hypothetical protein